MGSAKGSIFHPWPWILGRTPCQGAEKRPVGFTLVMTTRPGKRLHSELENQHV